jgi:prepilin-type N-terminal cleavage/methylation domain-containing protein
MKSATRATPCRHISRFTFHVSAFTLIELLVVMAVIGTLAAMLLAVVGGVKKKQYVYNTQAEMEQLETAIERYKAAYGVYPPSPTNAPTAGNPSTLVNQLYYELEGTAYTNGTYTVLDGSAQITDANVAKSFPGCGGFINCTKAGSGEDSARARNFLPDLRPKQIWPQHGYSGYTNNNATEGVFLLIGSVGGPDANFKPLGPLMPSDVNPWRYNSSNPTNNPGAYDLWIQLVVGGKTNLICNWSKKVLINSPF